MTLHPVVFYYKQNDEELLHKSSTIVSDCFSHNASTVTAFLQKVIVPKAKEVCPDVTFVHYWSDSPTSQYRNKTIFSIINCHKVLFGSPASWNCFKAGHGKGSCDGAGGTSKRMADQAMKRNIKIQSTADFYSWASTTQTLVDYEFISKDFCEELDAQLKEYVFKPIPGTMKLHSVVSIGNGTLYTRELSCLGSVLNV